jgi:hypothetical protein
MAISCKRPTSGGRVELGRLDGSRDVTGVFMFERSNSPAARSDI